MRLPSPVGNGRETKHSHTAISSGGNDSASITASHPLALSTELTMGWAELQGRPPSHFQKERMRQEEEQRRRSKWQGQKREGENRRKETGRDRKKGALVMHGERLLGPSPSLSQFRLWSRPQRAHAFPPKLCSSSANSNRQPSPRASQGTRSRVCERTGKQTRTDVSIDSDAHMRSYVHTPAHPDTDTLIHADTLHTHAHTHAVSRTPPTVLAVVTTAVLVVGSAAQRCEAACPGLPASCHSSGGLLIC